MGTSRSARCNSVCFDIWNEARKGDYSISTTYIPGRLNVEADKESRRQEALMEWMLNPNVYQHIVKIFNITPNIDLFASRLNFQLKPFASFRPDPEATHVNCYLLSWTDYIIYAFPPFNQIAKTLLKIEMDKASGILIVPNWPKQLWYSKLRKMSKRSFLIHHRKDLLTLPSSKKHHPLYKCLDLLAVLV